MIDHAIISRMRTYLSIIFLLISHCCFAQKVDYKFWSDTDKLVKEDFQIKAEALESGSSFAQFAFDYKVNGFDFLTRNFNKKVRNYMIKSASWLDTNTNMRQSILYQQTLFDIAEIYARTFRKELRENRSKILKGTEVIEAINIKLTTAFSKRRLAYTQEANFATNSEAQTKWEKIIRGELDGLKQFAY